MFVCMLIEWYVQAEILAFEIYPDCEPYMNAKRSLLKVPLTRGQKYACARETWRTCTGERVAGNHCKSRCREALLSKDSCPRNQRDDMARSPSIDPQIWRASSKSLLLLASSQLNSVRGDKFLVRIGKIDLRLVFCFFFSFLLCTGWCFPACNCRWPWSFGQDTDAIFWEEQEPCCKGKFFRRVPCNKLQ